MKFLFFDTETTGLPINFNAPIQEVTNWPRVIQLAWDLSDIEGNTINTGKFLIEPDGWIMPTGKFWRDNGFDHTDSMLEGEPIKEVLKLFVADLMQCDFLVSHNLKFDRGALGAEMVRAGIRGKKVGHICTKELSTEYCKIPSNYAGYGYKWPRLEELHDILFGEGFLGAHDAMADVKALKRCFYELLKLEVIKLPTVTA